MLHFVRVGLVGVVVFGIGCTTANSIDCGDRLCPQGTVCDAVHESCASHEQLDACSDAATTTCLVVGGIEEFCDRGVCLPVVCGDGIVAGSEVCDDHNVVDGDACRADCHSELRCGDGVVDRELGESCDDANTIDHDGCATTCTVESPHWVRHPWGIPSRYAAPVAYDSARDRIVVVGGQAIEGSRTDTLEWNGEWTASAATLPFPREGAAMVYDTSRHVLVLHGGHLTDTWEFDGTAWHRGGDGTATYRAALAYDEVRQRTVKFGGDTDGNATNAMAEYANGMWTALPTTTGPSPRSESAMVYDPVRHTFVLFGGRLANGGATNETWEYDPAATPAWKKLGTLATPTARRQVAMAYSSTRAQIVMFGGERGDGTPSDEAFALDRSSGATWTALPPTGLSALADAALVPDGHGNLMLVGGRLNLMFASSSIVLFDGSSWFQPSPFRSQAVATDITRREVVLAGGQPFTSGEINLYTHVFREGEWARFPPPPTAPFDAAATYDETNHVVMMFGGNAGGTLLADLYLWDGTTWHTTTTTTAPSPRQGAALTFAGDHVVAFGGFTPDAVDDTWTWNGNAWTAASPASHPNARGKAAIGFDRVHHTTILFGGEQVEGGLPLGDTWMWNGSEWTEITIPPGGPAPRRTPVMAWNEARQRLVLSGGTGLLDAWEWDGDAKIWVALALDSIVAEASGAYTSRDGSGVTVMMSGADDGFNFTGSASIVWDVP